MREWMSTRSWGRRTPGIVTRPSRSRQKTGRRRLGGRSWNATGSGGPGLPVLGQDPVLHRARLRRRAVRAAEVVEVLPLRARPEGTGRKGHVDVAVHAPPQREPDQLHAGQGAVLENDLRVAHQPLGSVLLVDELNAHLHFLLLEPIDGEAGGESAGRMWAGQSRPWHRRAGGARQP